MKELYDAFGRGDVATVLAGTDDNIEWYEAEGNPWYLGRPFVGPRQVVEGVIQRIGADFDGFEILPTRFLNVAFARELAGWLLVVWLSWTNPQGLLDSQGRLTAARGVVRGAAGPQPLERPEQSLHTL